MRGVLHRYTGAVDGLNRMLAERDADEESDPPGEDAPSLSDADIDDAIDVFDEE